MDTKQDVIDQYNRVFKILDGEELTRIENTIVYGVVGYCVTKHKKRSHKKIAVCEIDGVKYCYACSSQLFAKYHISQKPLKKAKRLKFRRNTKKYRAKQKQKTLNHTEWKKRVFAGWADTPEQAAFRRSPAYQEWRVIVLERDKYTCQHCEQTGGRLVVHHVKTFKMHPELRLVPDNGIVLCNSCHEKLHLSRVKQPKTIKLRA